MKIILNANEVSANKSAIRSCLDGEMCRIMRIENTDTGEIEHVIAPTVIGGGWSFDSGRSFHGSQIDGSYRKTGLGTFYLVHYNPAPDGGCVLEFTDDLNPDMQ